MATDYFRECGGSASFNSGKSRCVFDPGKVKMLILVDGFIMTNCLLAAMQLYPAVRDYAVFGHCGDECGHKLVLEFMNAKPLLHLGLRLGEGTGAICAYPLVESAVRMINEMDSFAHASITKYF